MQILNRTSLRTFQKVEVFGGMTVLDNIRLGRHIFGLQGGERIFHEIFRMPV